MSQIIERQKRPTYQLPDSNSGFTFWFSDNIFYFKYGNGDVVSEFELINRLDFRKRFKNFDLSNQEKNKLWDIVTKMYKFGESLDDHQNILGVNEPFTLGVFYDGRVEVSYHGDEVQNTYYLSNEEDLKNYCKKLDLSDDNQQKVYNYILSRDEFRLITNI